jgi:hypothetical protein
LKYILIKIKNRKKKRKRRRRRRGGGGEPLIDLFLFLNKINFFFSLS